VSSFEKHALEVQIGQQTDRGYPVAFPERLQLLLLQHAQRVRVELLALRAHLRHHTLLHLICAQPHVTIPALGPTCHYTGAVTYRD
jgi:hypothetical protein